MGSPNNRFRNLLGTSKKLARPLCRNVSGNLVVQILEDFAGDFPGGFFWALFFHKNEEKKSGDKIREKILAWLPLQSLAVNFFFFFCANFGR